MHVVTLICDLRIYNHLFCSELVCFYLKVLCLLEGNANVLRAINVLKIKSSNKLKLFVCVLVCFRQGLTGWARLALNSFYSFLFPKYSHTQFDFFFPK